MKDYLPKIEAWFQKIKEGKISYEKKELHPKKEWKIMLTSTFVFLICLAIFAFYFYLKIEAGEIFVTTHENVGKETEINKTLLKKVVTEIQTNEAFIDNLKKSGGVPNDPSL